MKDLGFGLLEIIIGLGGGIAVGSGLVAFLVVLDLIPRLAQISKSYHRIHSLEGAVVGGAVLFTAMDFFDITFTFSFVITGVFGLFAGVFVGMLAGALTEVLNVLPILAKRLNIKSYMLWLLMAMVFGKMVGSLLDWLVFQQ